MSVIQQESFLGFLLFMDVEKQWDFSNNIKYAVGTKQWTRITMHKNHWYSKVSGQINYKGQEMANYF